jgi:hypothetical protein
MWRGLHAPVIGLIISIKDILEYIDIEEALRPGSRINYLHKISFRIY